MLNLRKLVCKIANMISPTELQRLDPAHVDQLARDIGVTSYDLRRLSERDSAAADLLYSRLFREGIDARNVTKEYPRVMKDMQLTCSCCDKKERCARDIASAVAREDWKPYCPNAATIDDLR